MVNLIVPTLIALALVLWLPDEQRLGGRLYGTYIPMSAIGLICAINMFMRGRSFRLEHVKYALKLSLPLLVHFLTVSLLTSSNTMITKSIMGAEEAALISITTSTIHILTILFQALSGAVTTWLMDNLNQNNVGVVRKGIVLYSAGVVVVAIGTILLAPEIIWVLGGKQYMAAVDLIPGMVLGIVFQSVASVFNIILTYDKNVVKTAVYTGIVAVVSIAAKILLLPVFGYGVLAWANAAAFGALFVINYLLVKKAGYGRFINLKLIAAVILACAVVVGLSFVLYQQNLVRYGIIAVAAVVACAVLFKCRHMVIRLVKSKLNKKKSKV
jgi:O-antigen/teichoic acid export membrane protein